MSTKMNFAYKPPQAAPEVRPPLLTLGYFVLACSVILWMARPFLVH